MEKLGIEVNINANVKGLMDTLRTIGNKDVPAMQKLLDRNMANLVRISKDYPESFKAALDYAKVLKKELSDISKQKSPFTQDQQDNVYFALKEFGGLQKSGVSDIKKREREAERALQKEIKETEKVAIRAAKEKEKAEKAAAKAQEDHHDNLVRTRYALYDVAAEARRVGLVMVGLSFAVVKMGADYERAFADVKRTTDLTGTQLQSLKQDLLDISTSTSINFGDVSSIATMGAQMNVANISLAEFSDTVAKFGAVTGVSVEESAAAFGRLDQMFPGVQGNYEKLGSSILYAGRNAIATEAEITTLTTQIAASASQAGYSAEQTIGLATALASLKIAPEQARGVILRLFGDFDRMVSDGGQRLKDYAALMGMTSEQVANLWKTDAPAFMEKFTASLTSSAGSAEDFNSKLSALGIVETREINVLQRLAGNHDVLTKAMNDATSAYADGTDLSGQYGIVADTLIEKMKRLQNTFGAFTSSIGEAFAPAIKAVMDTLSNLFEAMSKTPLATIIGAIVVAVSAAIGVFLLWKATIGQAMASIFALKTTMTELAVINGELSISLMGVAEALAIESGAAKGAAASTGALATTQNVAAGASGRLAVITKALGAALIKSLPWLVAISAAFEVVSRVQEQAVKDTDKFKKSIDTAVKDTKGKIDEIAYLDPSKKTGFWILGNDLSDFQGSLQNLKSGSTIMDSLMTAIGAGDASTIGMAEGEIKALDEAMAGLVAKGDIKKVAELHAELAKQAAAVGYTQEELANLLPSYTDAVANGATDYQALSDAQLGAASSGEELSGVIKDRLTGSLTTSQNAYADYASAVKQFMTDLDASGGSINAWSDTGSQALSSFSGLLDAIIQQSGNDMKGALTQTAAALMLIESKGGDASSQVQGLVERINSLYGLNIDPTTITSMTELQSVIANTGGIAASTRAEIAAMVSGGDYGDVYAEIFAEIQKATSDGGDAVKAEVTSVFDYVSGLSGLFSDIIDQTYRLTDAQDAYSNGWDDTRDAVKKTKKEVANLKLEVLNLKSSGKDLENQLSIAKAYGDADQIMRIQAEIAANNQKIAETEKEITAANEERNMSLKGGSQAARENRAEIRSRVDDASALVAAYASTAKANGQLPTQAEVQSYANTIATQFRNQATAIGFSASELEQYITTIQGFGTAAANVEAPTIDVTLNPVDTAVQAYLDKKKSTKVTIVPNDDGLAARIQAILDRAKLEASITGSIMVDPASLKKQRDAFPKTSPMWSYFNGLYNDAYSTLQDAFSTSSLFRADGGLITGPGTSRSDSIPTMLSNGEYVINASSVDKYGVDFLNSINQQRGIPVARPAAASSSGSSAPQVVYLSVQDRELLQSALNRPVSLYTSDRVIAQSANNGNKELARRGATS